MTCGSGCCKPAAEEDMIPAPVAPVAQDESPTCCSSGACDQVEPAPCDQASQFSTTRSKGDGKDGCCASNSEPAEKGDACCGPVPPADDACHVPASVQNGNDDCEAGCCPIEAQKAKNLDEVPECCEGKPSPCCDSSCIDRLAFKACTESNVQDDSATRSCQGTESGKACREHAQSAYKRFQGRLEAIGCICRALLALGQESCCAPQKGSPRKQGSRRSSGASRSSRSEANTKTVRSNERVKRACGRRSSAKPVDKDCCASSSVVPLATSCAKSCCAEEKPPDIQKLDKQPLHRNLTLNDPEKGGSSGQEHVVLAISGMTCTGCETKLQRTLANLGQLTNLKTSLVLARAEFDIDLATASAADVIKHLERTTEFKCERITDQGSSLDLICRGNAADLVDRQWPDGVKDVKAMNKETIRVDFDPDIVGARDLVESGWGTPLDLAPPQPDRGLDAGNRHVRQVGYMTLLSIVLTIPVLVMAWAPLPDNEMAYSCASLALATIVQIAIAGPFYPKAIKSIIFSRVIEMDLLIVLSTTAAYVFSVVSFAHYAAGHSLSTGQFFETSTLLITLIMVGRYVAALARQKAAESISIRSLQATTATIRLDDGARRQIDTRLLQSGDIFEVAPHTKIPTDGTVISGSSEVNESLMTGESRPVEKHPGSSVVAGSINGLGVLTVRLTRLPGNNTISTIAAMVDDAKLSKPRIQELADRIASYFVPVVAALTILTFVVWIAVGVAVRGNSASRATVEAVTYAITVLIVSCPCAIGLAVPMVVVIASGVAAERGVVFKSSHSIELAYRASHVIFDKTGTLTQGKLVVSQVEYIGEMEEETKSLLLGLVGDIKHPVSSAVAAHLKADGVTASPTVTNSKSIVGKGVQGEHLQDTLRAGDVRWTGMEDDARVQTLQSHGKSTFCFSVNDSPVAIFGLEDSLRPDAHATVSKLQDAGVTVHLISGDNEGAVRAVSSELAIPDQHVRSRCTPQSKLEYIKEVEASGSMKSPVVIFCGDGTNDAAALAQATVGIHLSEGTDEAKSAADVVLMRPALAGVLTAMAISKKSIHRIRFNFGWSFVYNLFAILLGAGAFVNARIPPAFAGLGELVSVLPVIAAAVMLRWAKI